MNPNLFRRPEFKKVLDFLGDTRLKSDILKLQELYYREGDCEFFKTFESIFGKDYSFPFNFTLDSSRGEEFLGKILNDIFLKLKRDKLMAMKIKLKDKQKRVQSTEEGEKLLRELTTVDRELYGPQKNK